MEKIYKVKLKLHHLFLYIQRKSIPLTHDYCELWQSIWYCDRVVRRECLKEARAVNENVWRDLEELFISLSEIIGL